VDNKKKHILKKRAEFITNRRQQDFKDQSLECSAKRGVLDPSHEQRISEREKRLTKKSYKKEDLSSDEDDVENINKEEILENVHTLQDHFYSISKKNTIFKKQQKHDCAKIVCENINLEKIIQMTFFILPNTNIIYFDYTIFKLFGNNSNFDTIVDYCLQITKECIEKNGDYEVRINLSTISISALERYKNIIELFSLKAIHLDLLKKIVIYNSPSFINSALQFLNRNNFLNQGVLQKTVYHKKEESDSLIKALFQSAYLESNEVVRSNL
jgi:hypothetical protein